MNQTGIVWIGFVLASVMAILQSALFPQIAFFAYAPFFSLLCLHLPLIPALWLAAIAGVVLDFFSSGPFGFHAIAATLLIAILHRYSKKIFKDQLLQLCVTTAMISLPMSCMEPILYFLFDRRMPYAGQSVFVDYLLMPLVDAVYAFIWFTAPLQLLEWVTYRIKLWRFKNMDQPKTLSELTLTAVETALFAGELLKEGFGTHYKIEAKEGVHNLVTEYDHRSEEAIIQRLRTTFPSSNFLAEESGETGKQDSDILWIVDPLDGTVNFAHTIPFFSVSIAAKKEGEIVLGVIYQPMTHELFVAEKGKGAYLNGRRLSVSSTHELKKAFLATGFPYNLADNPLHCIEHFTDFLRLGIPIRRLGAATLDLAYTAAGRFEAFFEVSLAPWDVAAGLLLIEEAGGTITHWNGSAYDPFSHGSIVASNGSIHDHLLHILQKKK